MKQIPRPISGAVLACAAIFNALPLVAQVPKTTNGDQAASVGADASPELTIADVEAALAAVESDTGIEEAIKDLLRPKYKQAIDLLQEAAANAAAAAEYREAAKTAPDRAKEVRDQMESLPSAESAAVVTPQENAEELQRDIDKRRAELNGLNNDLSQVASEIARVNGRPVQISARLPAAERELSAIRNQLASPEYAADATSPGRAADRILLQASQSKLLSESDMLKQEQLSQSVREHLLEAQQELLKRQVENATAALQTLDDAIQQRRASESQRVRWLADALHEDLPDGDEPALALATEVKALAKQFEEVVENLKEVTQAQKDVKAQLDGLNTDFESIQQQLELGGSGGAMAQVLFDLRRRALNARADVLMVQLPTLEQAQVAWLQAKDKLAKHSEVEEQFADRTSDAVLRIVATRRDVLEKLRTNYGKLTQDLALLEADKRQYLDKAKEINGYVVRQLFGVRTSPMISSQTLTKIPGSLQWAFGRDHWSDLSRTLRIAATREPVRTFGILVVVVGLLLLRRRISAALEGTGVRIRRISTDRYALTVEALVCTVLLAAPIPLLIGVIPWAIDQVPNRSAWLQDVAAGFWIATRVTLVIALLVELCRPAGLGEAHFGWSQETLAPLRRAMLRFAVVYVPGLALTISFHVYGEAPDYFDSIARIVFMLSHLWTAMVLWQLFRSQDGLLAMLDRRHPGRLTTRWRYFWFPLVIASPLALIVLAAMGYLITAVGLSFGLFATVALVALGAVLYSLSLRWFMIRHRRLALQEALDRRRAQQEAAASDDEPSGEVISVDPEDEDQLDLESMSEQTAHLLGLVFSLAVAVAIIVFWSSRVPILPAFDTIAIPLTEGLTLLELLQAVLIVVVTYIAAKDAPGLLELAVLRATSLDAGTRNAISTLCQYAVITIGLWLVLAVLKVDWAKFGWIAAALSVGLGFGLQEVVANFVCGLILLFERPIRVGDVVTVEGTTGTVTKVCMRATTITNWDRQEFVVPNKTLITNTLLNWTLSAPLNRIVIPVGVAYGSDTDKARQILLDVAADHPTVLDDPAPMANFEQFADSSLNLVLRAFLPDLDNRLSVITELHTEINKRFTAAGIEIAFPQQDVHLRSGWQATGGPDPDGNGKREAAPAPEAAHPIS